SPAVCTRSPSQASRSSARSRRSAASRSWPAGRALRSPHQRCERRSIRMSRVRRREFLTMTAGALAAPRGSFTQSSGDAAWRDFEVVTTVNVLRPEGRTRVWLPTPLVDAPYQRTSGDTYRAEGGFVEMVERPADSIDVLVAEWPAGVA